MKNISYENVTFTSGFLFDKQELNRTITLDAVYNQFFETGRIALSALSTEEKENILWKNATRVFPNAFLS